jgi:hypothetical protein
MHNGRSAVHVASLDKPASTLERVTAAYMGRLDVLGWIEAQQARTARLPYPRIAPQLSFFAYGATIEEVQRLVRSPSNIAECLCAPIT